MMRAGMYVLLLSLLLGSFLRVSSSLAAGEARINLNEATVAELMTLPNVGRKRANAIIRRRLARPFRRPSELMKIRGIGRKIYLRIKPYVFVPAASGSRASPAPPDSSAQN